MLRRLKKCIFFSKLTHSLLEACSVAEPIRVLQGMIKLITGIKHITIALFEHPAWEGVAKKHNPLSRSNQGKGMERMSFLQKLIWMSSSSCFWRKKLCHLFGAATEVLQAKTCGGAVAEWSKLLLVREIEWKPKDPRFDPQPGQL